jgi:hypothetical protein
MIFVKYCGGCNPLIDRESVVQNIAKLLAPDSVLTSEQSNKPSDIGILICGCSSACAQKPELENFARKWIVVAGKSVDLESLSEEKLADVVVKKLNEIK